MKLSKWKIFRSGLLRKVQNELATTDRPQPVIIISSTGVISRTTLPMKAGYIEATPSKMSWFAHPPLRIIAKNKRGEIEQDPVFLLSELYYLPLDVFQRMTDELRAKMTALTQVARLRHSEKLSSISEGNITSNRDKAVMRVITGCLILAGLMILTSVIRGCSG